jgi:beta-glucanase (GH16 family)
LSFQVGKVSMIVLIFGGILQIHMASACVYYLSCYNRGRLSMSFSCICVRCASLVLLAWLAAFSKPPASAVYSNLYWSDEFNSLSIDKQRGGAAKWSAPGGFLNWYTGFQGTNGFSTSGGAALPDNLYEITTNGTLMLRCLATPSAALASASFAPFVGPAISTNPVFYRGYFEIRARFIGGMTLGMHPYFGMFAFNKWPPEVEISEFYGNVQNWCGDADNRHSYTQGLACANWACGGNNEVGNVNFDQWNTYGFCWGDDSLRWYLNDSLTYTANAASSLLIDSMLININYITGNTLEILDSTSRPNFPSELELDYVRVYEKP